ncbi:MAG TPA: ABC transporter permease [Fibrobacteria bacterium]|nr:ABC transporter permease [Fibrobacteria bacterium]
MNLFAAIDRAMVRLGGRFLRAVRDIVRFLRFCVDVFLALPSVFKNFHFTVDQMYLIGITSVPLVGLTSIFTGAVAAWQAAYNFADYVPLRYVGTAVGKSVMLEVGPVLTALVVSGRVGAAMTAELGTMAVTEQLDAMKVLNLNPFRFLLAPRLLAGMVMLPLLTIFSSFVAILGALAVVTWFKGLSPESFWYGVRLFYTNWDLFVGILKSFVFGIIISIFGCYYGYSSTGGAEGVGRATMASVVASNVSVLISGFLISNFLLR